MKEIAKRTTLTVAPRAAFSISVKDTVGNVWQNINLTEVDEITVSPNSEGTDSYFCNLPGTISLFHVKKQEIHRLLGEKYLLVHGEVAEGSEKILKLPDHAWRHIGRS